MGGFISPVLGAVGGAIAGSQRDSGQDSGSNIFGGGSSYGLGQGQLQSNVGNAIDLTKQNTLANSTGQVQNNAILGQLFGNQGILGQSVGQAKDLMGQGYQLQPSDYDAYGKASGQIANMFGHQEQGLAQDMANRGLSNSGVAGQQFSGLFGNKEEQLGQLQTQIAQQRMQMNQQRLSQMQNFISQMGGQAQNAIGQANDVQNRQSNQEYNQNMGYMNAVQGKDQKAFDDRQNTMGPSQFSNFITGATSGMGAAANMGSALSGSKAGTSAGGSSLFAGALA